jgi:hypothetical protein
MEAMGALQPASNSRLNVVIRTLRKAFMVLLLFSIRLSSWCLQHGPSASFAGACNGSKANCRGPVLTGLRYNSDKKPINGTEVGGQRQGGQAEARQLLAPIYGWFTEGFDTVELREAKALLEQL